MTATLDQRMTRFVQRLSSRQFTPWLGVDVGTYAVKLAVVARDGMGGARLTHAQRIMWPAGAEPFQSAEQFGQALKGLLRESQSDWAQYGVRTAAFTLPACAFSHQPMNDASEAAAAMQDLYQAASDELAFDCWSTPETDDVTLVWAEPGVVQAAIKAFGKCGLSADVLDTASFATARASQLASKGTANSELVIDGGAGGITLTWLCNGEVRFNRTSIQGGGMEALEAVAATFSLGIPEAELLLSKYGLPGAVDDELRTRMEVCFIEALELVLQEIDRTVNFLGSRFPRDQVQSCLLIGGGAAIRNLPFWISQQTERPTHVWSLPASGSSQFVCDLRPTPLFAQAAAQSALALEQ